MKKHLTLLALASLTLASGANAALISYYNLNEAANTAVIADSSGNGYDATQATLSALTLGATSVTAGTYGALTVSASDAANFGTSANFDAVSGGTDRFDINTAGATAIAGLLTANGAAAPTGTFTLMAWVNVTNNANTFFLGTGNGGSDGWKFGLNVQEAFVTANVQQHLGSTTVSTNAWHHVAFTYNNGAGSFFLDGIAAGTGSYTGYNEDSLLASIGSRPTGTEAFTGKVDELKIYDTALTLSEIQVAAVPEPSTYGLMGASAVAAVAFVRRRKRAA